MSKTKEAYFELDGKYGAIYNRDDGGVTFVQDAGGVGMAEFMRDGVQVKFTDLPVKLQKSITEGKKQTAK